MTDAVTPSNIRKGLALGLPGDSLFDLKLRQLRLAAKANTAKLSPRSAFTGPRLDQLTFKLGNRTEYVQQEPSMSRCCIHSGIIKHFKSSSRLGDNRYGVE